jgi:hypothetical protein
VTVLRLALVALLGVVAIGVALWQGQRRLIYFPDPAVVPPAATVVPGAQDILLDTSDGLRLRAWLVTPARPRNVAILVAPGNAGNRLHRAPLARALAGEGFTVLLVEYRGYGGNPGSPTEQGLRRDVRAAREYLTGGERVGLLAHAHLASGLSGDRWTQPQPYRGVTKRLEAPRQGPRRRPSTTPPRPSACGTRRSRRTPVVPVSARAWFDHRRFMMQLAAGRGINAGPRYLSSTE